MIYTHAWAPMVGGVQTVTRDLANGLIEWHRAHPEEAIDVTLVTQTAAGNMDDSEVPFRVVRQPSNRKLISLIHRADILHIANPALIPLTLGWMFRKPVVVEHDGYQAACPNGLLLFQPDRRVCPGYYLAGCYAKCVQCNSVEMGWFKSLLSLLFTFPRRWLTRRVAVNITPTKHIGRRVALPRTRVIPHGVPRYVTFESGGSFSEDAGIPTFAYVGRLVSEKGVPVLLGACSILAAQGFSFRLKIVGDGDQKKHLEQSSAELGLGSHVAFLGAIPVNEIPQLLHDAIAVIMPSIWEDVAPLVAYEQLMHGHLVIASDIGGLGEIVGDVGLKFPPGDAHALAACMRRVIEEPSLAKDLRSRARQRAQEDFTLESMVANHLSVFKELAERAAPSAAMNRS